MSVLITGGLGYVGSNIAKDLIQKGEEVVIVDNLSNSLLVTFKNLKEITKKNFKFYAKDLLNEKDLIQIFKENQIESVINLAEPVFENTLDYYNKKTNMLLNLLNVMNTFNVKRLIQASSDIYNDEGVGKEISKTVDILDGKVDIKTKTDKICENIINQFYAEQKDEKWSINILRIFNVCGVDSTGLLGDTKINKDDIFSKILRFYINKETVKISNKYISYDNTKIRDYIHVSDVSTAIQKSLNLVRSSVNQINTFNISTGTPTSENMVIKLFETITKSEIKREYTMLADDRISVRTGDKTLANSILKFDNKFSIDIIIRNTVEYSHNYNQIIKENKEMEKQLQKQSKKGAEVDGGENSEE